MHWQEIINVRQRCLDATSERFVISSAKQGIEPDQTMTVPLQAPHLALEQLHVATIPAVADDEHHRAASEYAPPPIEINGLERFTDARTARPIMDEQSHIFERYIKVTDLKRAGDPCQTRAKEKGFHRLTQ